jgi:hypothetical protein
MSVKDLISKGNRNQAFTYDIDGTHNLASLAAQQRYEKSSSFLSFLIMNHCGNFQFVSLCSFGKDTYVGRKS